MLSSPSLTSPAVGIDVVVVCPESSAPLYRDPLQPSRRIAVTASPDNALQLMKRADCGLLVVDGDAGEMGTTVCKGARQIVPPPMVLVTLSSPEAAPAVLDLCDSILMKPFAANLLASRVGRLLRLRERVQAGRSNGHRQLIDRHASTDAAEQRAAGTLVERADGHCPQCDHQHIVMFDYASTRRAWYACKGCRAVWLARRIEC